jgi:tetratricopeptide (TPR) repeat protein
VCDGDRHWGAARRPAGRAASRGETEQRDSGGVQGTGAARHRGGIATYPDSSQLPPLKYTARDAEAVAAALEKNGYEVRRLLNEQAGTQAVREALSSLRGRVRGDATVVFYFAGHGVTAQDKLILATHGATAGSPETSGLSQAEVDRLLQESGAKRRIMWLDACRNRAAPGSRSLPIARSAVRFAISRGTRVLYAAANDKESFEADELQHGVFTHYLVEGLNGSAAQTDGFITFDDLSSYVTTKVIEWGFAKGRTQEPHADGEHSGDFLVAAGPKGEPASPPTTKPLSFAPTDSVGATSTAEVRRLHEDERWADSLPLLTRLMANQPGSPELLALRAHAYSHLRRQADALADAERAVQLGPQNAEAYLRRGEVHMGAERYVEALADLDRSVKLNPKDAEAWGNRGFTLLNRSQYKEAVDSFDRGLALRKDRYDLWYGRGISRYELGDRQAALADLSEAVALRPDQPTLYRDRARLHLLLKQYDAALRDANHAVKLAPDDPDLLVTRGSIYSEVGNVDNAVRDLRYALRLRPDLKDVPEMLRALEARGTGNSPPDLPSRDADTSTPVPGGDLSYARLQDDVAAAMRAQRFIEAGEIVDQMVRLAPGRPEGWALRGVLAMTAYDNLPLAYESFENALARGGDAAFRVAHDHGLDQVPCFGVMGMTAQGVSFRGETGGHQFQWPYPLIREAAINGLYGSAFGMFHIKTGPADGSKTYNFLVVRPTDPTIVNRRPDAEMLLGLINRRRQ